MKLNPHSAADFTEALKALLPPGKAWEWPEGGLGNAMLSGTAKELARREFERAFNATSDPLIRAQRAIIRAYMSFHHGALFNPKKCTFADARHRKAGNHPKSHEWSNYPRHLASICRRLSGIVIECRDALEVIRVQDTPDGLFFVEPPYVHNTRDKQTRYRHELNDARHVELLTALKGCKGKVMISGYASALYDDLLTGWQRLSRKHYAAAGSIVERTEVLWIKPD